MDRQVVDRDGLMVCKVDDVELTEHPRRSLGGHRAAGRAAGARAEVRRPARRGARGELAAARPPGGRPAGAVADRARARRRARQRRHPARRARGAAAAPDRLPARARRRTPPPQRRPAARGFTTDGETLGQVLDVRLRPARRREPLRLVAEGLVVGRGRPGGYLGYDRDGKQGPWLLNRLVRRIHRHSGYVPMADVGARRLGRPPGRGHRAAPTARPPLIDPPSGCGRARRGRARKVGKECRGKELTWR